jgi:hypothetical protein
MHFARPTRDCAKRNCQQLWMGSGSAFVTGGEELACGGYRAATCFLPYTRSIIAVSPYNSARTVLPSRRVYTSAS